MAKHHWIYFRLNIFLFMYFQVCKIITLRGTKNRKRGRKKGVTIIKMTQNGGTSAIIDNIQVDVMTSE